MASRFRAYSRFSRHRVPRGIAEINVVPYVDVLLVLLVIFMVSMPVVYSGVNIELPSGGAEALPSRLLPLIVTIGPNGTYYLESHGSPERPVDEAALRDQAKSILERDRETPVILRADRNTDFGTVITMMALLKEVGATDIGLMTRRKYAPRSG